MVQGEHWCALFLFSVRHCRDPLFCLLSPLEAEDVGAKNMDLQKSASPRCEIKTKIHSSVLGEQWCSLFFFSVHRCPDPLFSVLSPLEAEDVGAKNVDLQKSASPRCEIKTRFHSSVLGEHWCALFFFSCAIAEIHCFPCFLH